MDVAQALCHIVPGASHRQIGPYRHKEGAPLGHAIGRVSIQPQAIYASSRKPRKAACTTISVASVSCVPSCMSFNTVSPSPTSAT
jgi:hypothetical protein